MNDFIDRYVWAVAKDLPDDARDDVARELRATIEDMVEARGPASDETAREVLAELGDPAELALRYSGRTRCLIGPSVYPRYARLLKILLLVIVPVGFAATLIDRLRVAGDDVVPGILAAVNGGLQAGVMVAFWVTFVFVILERVGVGSSGLPARAGKAWGPDALPPVCEKRQITLAGTIFSLAGMSLLIFFVFWLRSHSVVQLFTGHQWVDAEGGSTPFLEEGLWGFWMPAFVVVVVASMVVEVWKYLSGRWTLPLVLANILMNVLFAGVVIMIESTQRVIAPEFLTTFRENTGADFPAHAIGTGVLLLVVAICLWDSIDCVLVYARVRRAPSAGNSVGGAA